MVSYSQNKKFHAYSTLNAKPVIQNKPDKNPILVMLCNILLAVIITMDVLAIYKLHQYFVTENVLTITVSLHSVLMFAVCSLGLTIAFSLFFARRATRVEIAKYLKAE